MSLATISSPASAVLANVGSPAAGQPAAVRGANRMARSVRESFIGNWRFPTGGEIGRRSYRMALWSLPATIGSPFVVDTVMGVANWFVRHLSGANPLTPENYPLLFLTATTAATHWFARNRWASSVYRNRELLPHAALPETLLEGDTKVADEKVLREFATAMVWKAKGETYAGERVTGERGVDVATLSLAEREVAREQAALQKTGFVKKYGRNAAFWDLPLVAGAAIFTNMLMTHGYHTASYSSSLMTMGVVLAASFVPVVFNVAALPFVRAFGGVGLLTALLYEAYGQHLLGH